MKFLVINTKGGCGKSTLSSQILAPYLYVKVNSRNSKSLVCEMDKFNHDAQVFRRTNILESRQIDPLSECHFDMERMLLDDISCIVDSGGNASGEAVLAQYIKSGFINRFDMIFIPFVKGEQSIINAIKTYKTIRKFSETKVMFCLSNITSKTMLKHNFVRFFGDKFGRLDGFEGYINQISEADRNFIYTHDTPSLEYSRIYGKTIFELYENGGEKGINYEKKLDIAMATGGDKQIDKAYFAMTIYGYAEDFYTNSIEPCFNEIESYL